MALFVWLEDEAQKWLSVSDDVGEEDHASKGWFAYCIWSPKNLEFKVLLILDNAAVHPQDLGLTLLNNQAENLANTTTSLLQLFNQGISVMFKRDYTYCTFHIILYACEETFVNVSECWNQ